MRKAKREKREAWV